MAKALYTFLIDSSRIQSLLPELSARDRSVPPALSLPYGLRSPPLPIVSKTPDGSQMY